MTINDLDFNKKYTYADYLKWTFDETIELIRGRVFRMAAPLTNHQTVVGNSHLFFGMQLKKTPCRVYIAPFDVRLPKPMSQRKDDEDIETVVQPDVCVVCDVSKIDRRGCNGVPDLIVEVLSKGTANKDVKDKFEVYEEAGVKEYWIVGIDSEIVQVYRLKDGRFIPDQRLYGRNDIIKVGIFNDFQVPVEEIFEGVIDFDNP
jgi:Uma2 family endonuclease